MRRCALEVTPAYAGKSHSSEPKCRSNWDHPRVCGEKRKDFGNGEPKKRDHPPRVREKRKDLKRRTEKRDHPRVCGEKLKFGTNVTKNPDHPRVCGEKAEVRHERDQEPGSPPRVRGKGIVHVFVPEKLGITPAYAGKSPA